MPYSNFKWKAPWVENSSYIMSYEDKV
jgi:hypothetical protein